MTKRTMYILHGEGKQIFLIGYHNPKSFNENELYFGTFFPLSMPKEKNLSIRKRYFFDIFNIFRKELLKLNNKDFDSQIIMNGNDENIVKEYLSDYSIQTLILDSLNLTDAIIVGFNCVQIDFVPEFQDKSNFGIFTRLKWFTDNELIEKFFMKIEKFNDSFSKIEKVK